MIKVAVTSRSFSKHLVLRTKLLEQYSNVKFNDTGLSLSGESLIEFLSGYDKAIIALEEVNDNLLSALPELKVIGKFGVGLDKIDLNAMHRHGIKLGWKGGVNKRSVSELVVSAAISLLHRTVFASAEVGHGEWYQIKGRQLSECTVGIIGCGHIGKDLVNLLKPFNCNILSHDILDFPEFHRKNEVKAVALEELLSESDVVTLHLPLDTSTINIMNRERLKMMKDGAILINLARGGLIDEGALVECLKSNKLSGAALDVFAKEPPILSAFSELDNILITPHIGGSTEEAILAMGLAAIDGLDNAKDPLTFL
jgi:phosphoglycerate dehydrogenase-like enzyme